MSLKPETSVIAGLAVATVVTGVYANALPSAADVRIAEVDNEDAASAEKAAAWTAAAVVAGISLITKDPTVFVIGGGFTVLMSWWYKHSNSVNPEFHTVLGRPASTPEDVEVTAPIEQYVNSPF